MARPIQSILAALWLIGLALPARGSGERPEQAPAQWRLGLRVGIGGSTAFGSFDDHFRGSNGAQLRFCSGGGIELDRYISRAISVSTGVGVLDQGYRVRWYVSEFDTTMIKRVLYLRIPLKLAVDLSKYQIGAGLLFEVGLYGRTVAKYKGVEEMAQWRDADWDHHRRFNVAANLFAGQMIPVGPVILIQAIDFSIQLLNNIQGHHPNGEALTTTERHFVVLATLAAHIDL